MIDDDVVMAQPGAKQFVKEEPMVRRRRLTEEDIVANIGGKQFFPELEPLSWHSLFDETKYGSAAAIAQDLREQAEAERVATIWARFVGASFVVIPLAVIALLYWWVQR